MTPLRVLMVAPHAQRYGGAEVHLVQLVAGLAAWGSEVTVLHRSAGHVDIPSVAFVRCSDDEHIERALAEDDGAIVHVHDNALGENALRRLRARRPVVRSWHNASFACMSGTHLLAGRPCPRAHGPACVTHVALRHCVERLNPLPALGRWREVSSTLDGAPEDRETIFYSEYARSVGLRNGLPPERCHVLRYFVQREVAPIVIPRQRAVCFAGRLTKLKGVDVLLAAVARAHSVRRLDIVGDGYFRAELERLARRLGVADRVRFHGWLDEERIRAVMASSDVVAVPSTWPEPFGIVGLEAMSLGRPTLGSAIGGIPEWLADGEVGRLVAPSDVAGLARTLDQMLDDDEALVRMGRAAWQQVAAFSADAHIAGLDAIYARAQAQ